MVARAKEIGAATLGITDHNLVAGHVEFYKAAMDEGIKPALGVEIYQAPESRLITPDKQPKGSPKNDNFHLILLAQNNTGLENLWSISTEAHRSGFYRYGRVDWDLLEKYNEGLICTSACALGLLPQYITHGQEFDSIVNRYLKIFGDRFYIELGTYMESFQWELNKRLVEVARTWGIPMLYANDAHYCNVTDYELHETVIAIAKGEKLAEKLGPDHSPCLYIMDEAEVMNYLAYLPDDVIDETLDNAETLASSINVTLPAYRHRTPVFITGGKYKDSWDMLFELAQEGFKSKVIDQGLDTDIYFKRLSTELEVIRKAHSSLADYLMIVRDYVLWAKDKGIQCGPGRGSIGGSLVAYLLDITEVDPIRYGLIFERWYNPGREKSLPDIDSDFSIEGRDRVREYISKKYGKDYVGDLGTVITLKGKGAINDLCRVKGIPITDARQITAIIEETVEAGLTADWEKINEKVGHKLEPWRNTYPEVFDYAEKLFDHVRSYGVHASGVIIGDEPLDKVFPLRWSAKDKKLITQWPMETAEEFGYMKVDLLRIRNLDVLGEVNRLLEEVGKEPIDYSGLHLQDHPEEMWQLLDKGLTIGIFQIEDGVQARSLARDIQPRSVEDLATIISLNRPGPDIKSYLKGRRGNIKVPENPAVAKATADTLYVLIYQEQLIELLTEIGYDLQEADKFRAIIGKKKIKDSLKEEDTFYKRLKKYLLKEGFSERKADQECDRLWKEFENFSRYGFNKAHGIEYAILGLRGLYAKYHYPSEFILALIRTAESTEDISLYLREAHKMGIKVYPPDVNKSDLYTSIKDDVIRFGLADIKYIRKQAGTWLINNRPFADRDDLITKSLDDKRKITLPSGMRKVGIDSRQIGILEKIGAIDPLQEWDQRERIEAEVEYLGFTFSDNFDTIKEKHDDIIQFYGCTNISEIESPGNYFVAGMITDCKKGLKTKLGQPFARMTLKDETGEISSMIWSNELVKFNFLLDKYNVGIFNLRFKDGGLINMQTAVLLE